MAATFDGFGQKTIYKKQEMQMKRKLMTVLQSQELNKFDAEHRKKSELLSTAEFVKI
jgi:hypothetical protein